MKKRLLTMLCILTAFFFMSCNSESSSTTQPQESIHPPLWILGTWSENLTFLSPYITYEFTGDNVEMYDSLMIPFVLNISLQDKLDSFSSFHQSSSSSMYSINFTDSDGSGTFLFTKTSDTTLTYSIDLYGYSGFSVTLTKE